MVGMVCVKCPSEAPFSDGQKCFIEPEASSLFYPIQKDGEWSGCSKWNSEHVSIRNMSRESFGCECTSGRERTDREEKKMERVLEKEEKNVGLEENGLKKKRVWKKRKRERRKKKSRPFFRISRTRRCSEEF